MKELISVIIPVYNMKRYLKRCLDSVISQTYRNLEVILVDDGSTDGSTEICDQYANEDSRVRVFHVKNGGVSRARNIGLDNAKGKYITFIDSDDFVPLDIYECMVKEIESLGCELIQCSIEWVYNQDELKIVKWKNQLTIPKKNFLKSYKNNIILGAIGGKLFKRICIGDLRFQLDLPVSEDQLFVVKYLEKINKVRTLEKAGYYYYQRNDSVTHERVNAKHFSDIVLFKKFFEIGLLDKNSLSGRMISSFLAKKSLNLILSILLTDTYVEKYHELRKVLVNNLRYVLINSSILEKHKLYALLIWICPNIFKYICLKTFHSAGK